MLTYYWIFSVLYMFGLWAKSESPGYLAIILGIIFAPILFPLFLGVKS